jgi:hypothetical protein
MYRELEKLALPKDKWSERLEARARDLGTARGKTYGPDVRMSGLGDIRSRLMEKEIIKQTGPGLGAKLRHHTIGKARRFWNPVGKSSTRKFLRRAGALGGIAGLGLLGKAWYDSSQNQKAIDQLRAQGFINKMGTTFDYTPNAPVTPKPPKFPSVPKPMSTNAGKPDSLIPGKAPKSSGGDYSGESAETKVAMAGGVLAKAAFLEEGVSPLLYGAGGAAGGYLLGKKVVDPLLSMGQDSLRYQINRAQKILEGLEKGKRVAPIAGATIGAILLAAIAAKKAKEKERATMNTEGFDYHDMRRVHEPATAYYYG